MHKKFFTCQHKIKINEVLAEEKNISIIFLGRLVYLSEGLKKKKVDKFAWIRKRLFDILTTQYNRIEQPLYRLFFFTVKKKRRSTLLRKYSLLCDKYTEAAAIDSSAVKAVLAVAGRKPATPPLELWINMTVRYIPWRRRRLYTEPTSQVYTIHTPLTFARSSCTS